MVLDAKDVTLVLDTKEAINAYRLLVLRSRMKLELKGMKSRTGSTFAVVRREFGLKGSRASILAQYETLLKDAGILKD